MGSRSQRAIRNGVFCDIVGTLYKSGVSPARLKNVVEASHYVDDLDLDSLDCQDLISDFEERYSLSIPDKDAQRLQTVGAAIDYIVENASFPAAA
jgi:acyl carrier protein